MTTSTDTPIVVTPAYGPVPAIYVPRRSDPRNLSFWHLVRHLVRRSRTETS